jgi:hypothetical protein
MIGAGDNDGHYLIALPCRDPRLKHMSCSSPDPKLLIAQACCEPADGNEADWQNTMSACLATPRTFLPPDPCL